jgi:hypothetical protein
VELLAFLLFSFYTDYMVILSPIIGTNTQMSRPSEARGQDPRVVVKQSLATTMPSDRQTSLGILQTDANKATSGDYDRWKKSKIFNPKQASSGITAENFLKQRQGLILSICITLLLPN